MPHVSSYTFKTIGFIESCYKQKFGVPRQPGIVKQATANLVFHPEFSQPDFFRGIEQYSHLWISFVFHQSIRQNIKATVRPPRLGGSERLGVFATRSNFRPNPIGQSVVRFEGVVVEGGCYKLKLTGVDILDGSPVLDIKPYLPYADSIPEAIAGFASQPPGKSYQVSFSTTAREQVNRALITSDVDLFTFIEELLSYDPIPAFISGKSEKKSYAMYLFEHNLQWELRLNNVHVLGYSPIQMGS